MCNNKLIKLTNVKVYDLLLEMLISFGLVNMFFFFL